MGDRVESLAEVKINHRHCSHLIQIVIRLAKHDSLS